MRLKLERECGKINGCLLGDLHRAAPVAVSRCRRAPTSPHDTERHPGRCAGLWWRDPSICVLPVAISWVGQAVHHPVTGALVLSCCRVPTPVGATAVFASARSNCPGSCCRLPQGRPGPASSAARVKLRPRAASYTAQAAAIVAIVLLFSVDPAYTGF
jgi:hypothetical protein